MNDGLVSYLPLMAKAAGTSIWLSWLGLLLGIVVGAGIALLRRSRIAPLRWLALIYTEFWRSIPILIVMFFAYYGAPLLLGFDLSPFTAATLALALHASASMAEIIRAALASVGRGQWEAAQAAGMSAWQVMRYVAAPQALRVALPPSIGVFITTLKESSLASVIGYIELTKTGLLVRDATGGGLAPLLALGAFYFILNYAISLAGLAAERRFHVGRRQDLVGAMT